MTIREDPNTVAQDRYYKCVNGFIAQSFDVTPEFVHDHLSKTVKVCVLFVDSGLSSMKQ